MTFEYGNLYEVGEGRGAALIAEMTSGRLVPVILRLHYRGEGSLLVSLERAHVDRDTIDFERVKPGGGGLVAVADFPCDVVRAVELVDLSGPLDRTDELRG